jgi:hypothetical protein
MGATRHGIRVGDHSVAYDAGLVEEAVLLHEPGLPVPERQAFRRERDRVYEVRDPEEREARFEELHGRWFMQLGLDRPLHETLSEQKVVLERTEGCRVLRASARADEMADVWTDVGGHTPRRVVVRLRPASFLDADRLRALLRHEFFHVTDMLDPGFAYQPELPPSDWGPAHDNLLRDRYRAVWDATIDGRLFHLGRLDKRGRELRAREFAQAFPGLGAEAEARFSAWFDEARPTHAGIVAFVLDPSGARSLCPICRLPASALDPDPDRLGAEAREELRSDHPEWDPSKGICAQCANLYLAHHPGGSQGSFLPERPTSA